jgi:hypothetical protein
MCHIYILFIFPSKQNDTPSGTWFSSHLWCALIVVQLYRDETKLCPPKNIMCVFAISHAPKIFLLSSDESARSASLEKKKRDSAWFMHISCACAMRLLKGHTQHAPRLLMLFLRKPKLSSQDFRCWIKLCPLYVPVNRQHEPKFLIK